jgi:hypothetical protein
MTVRRNIIYYYIENYLYNIKHVIRVSIFLYEKSLYTDIVILIGCLCYSLILRMTTLEVMAPNI